MGSRYGRKAVPVRRSTAVSCGNARQGAVARTPGGGSGRRGVRVAHHHTAPFRLRRFDAVVRTTVRVIVMRVKRFPPIRYLALGSQVRRKADSSPQKCAKSHYSGDGRCVV